jgi:hypothetical protein
LIFGQLIAIDYAITPLRWHAFAADAYAIIDIDASLPATPPRRHIITSRCR